MINSSIRIKWLLSMTSIKKSHRANLTWVSWIATWNILKKKEKPITVYGWRRESLYVSAYLYYRGGFIIQGYK